jgi:hypothetical protein
VCVSETWEQPGTKVIPTGTGGPGALPCTTDQDLNCDDFEHQTVVTQLFFWEGGKGVGVGVGMGVGKQSLWLNHRSMNGVSMPSKLPRTRTWPHLHPLGGF